MEASEIISDICFAYEGQRLELARAGDLHPAHYTTAENAVNILTGGSLWMRNAAVMNDFAEIDYGMRCLEAVMHGSSGRELQSVVDMAHPGLVAEVFNWLKDGEGLTRQHTYMASFSEHGAEDDLGRLSMWRAYGGPTAGVAIVFNREASIDEGQQQAFYSPVFYGHVEDVGRELGSIVQGLRVNLAALRSAPRDDVGRTLKRALHFAVLSTKHPGFQEEREWRAIWSPLVVSQHQQGIVRSVRGIPQRIYQLDLFNSDTPFERAKKVSSLIRQIIIGPCQYPATVHAAFTGLLADIGLSGIAQRVTVSGIPLRQRW